jgi:nucleoside-diphosphate-sugar epimerase
MRVFVTGATGWIGSAVVPELIAAGHEVTGLVRSDASAAALTAAGGTPVRGTLDDLETLREAAAASEGVIHLAFKHEEAFTGNFAGAVTADREAIDVLGAALEGTGHPFVIASGLAGHPSGTLVTEDDAPDADGVVAGRMRSEQAVLAMSATGVRAQSVRLAPTVHGDGDGGFVATMVDIARKTGVSGYTGEGQNTWPAVHRDDAARLFRLALENGPTGSAWHGAAEEGVPVRAVAEVIAKHLDLPLESIAPEAVEDHFGWLGMFLGIDVRASSALTQQRLGWTPEHPGLIADLELGHYFQPVAAG